MIMPGALTKHQSLQPIPALLQPKAPPLGTGIWALGGFAFTIGPVRDRWPAVLARVGSTAPARGAGEGGVGALVNRPKGTL